jgi:ketosteroid isomerase-like protein
VYSWLVKQALRRLEKQLANGEVDKLSASYSDDAHLVFPGDNSFGGDHRGKPAIRSWIQRFVGLRPTFTIGEVVAAGPPWNMRVMFAFNDRIVAPDGFEYRNEGMEFVRMRWGKIAEHRVALDTEKVTELDQHLQHAASAAV